MSTVKEIIDWFLESKKDVIIGENVSLTQVITSPRSFEDAKSNQIIFINKKATGVSLKEVLKKTQSILVILSETLYKADPIPELKSKAIILSEDPKTDLMLCCDKFLNLKENTKKVIDPKAAISTYAKVGANCSIGAFAVIEKNVIIGANSSIGANTVIKKNTVIGNNVVIGSNNVIGEDGFGFVKNLKDDSYKKFKHYGKVIIKDNVEVGSNVCIDRGSLKDTVIHKGVKIDNLVHIAHNVVIKENSLIIASSMIAGSVTIGKNCWIAPSVAIKNGITIGDNALVGLNSTVLNNISEGQIVVGSPATPLRKSVKHKKEK